MNYREDRKGNKISVLGYGCMRFTNKGLAIDFDKAEREVMTAFNAGVNYFDTAYVYPGSEELMGRIFEKNGIRDRVYIATKLPHYMIRKKEDAEKYFSEELSRLRTDHVDYYLMHMLNDISTWRKLCDMGIREWLLEKRVSGAIGQIGFSYHGNTDMFREILDDFDWDICQIQYNYYDINSQAGVTGLKYAAGKNVPVVIMEPLRGGRLARLPKAAEKLIREDRRKWTPAQWGFKWLWDQPEVTCVLSGMNSVEMVEENVRTASESFPGELNGEDRELLARVVKAVNSRMKVGCTGCRYCMPCPRGVDIPGTFAAYNTFYSDSAYKGIRDYFMCTALRKDPTAASRCIGCGKCELHCPQNIEIRKELKKASRVLEGLPYKAARLIAGMYIRY